MFTYLHAGTGLCTSFKDTDFDTAANATRASSVNNLTLYFLWMSVSARKNAKYFKLMSGK